MYRYLLLLGLLAGGSEAVDSYSLSGCLCLGECARTIDSPFKPWCVTSRGYNGSATDACGSTYSSARSAYWAYCTVNITNAAAAGVSRIFFPLTTFSSIFLYISVPAAAGVSAAYCFAGLVAAFRGSTAPLKTALWLPAAAAAAGALHGIVVGAPTAALIALLYLSLPYAIDAPVAVALGLSISALAVFSAINMDGLTGVKDE